MSSLSLRLPESLHQRLRELAERDGISINQFIATAVAEKAAALLTVEYLETRGQRADGKLVDRRESGQLSRKLASDEWERSPLLASPQGGVAAASRK